MAVREDTGEETPPDNLTGGWSVVQSLLLWSPALGIMLHFECDEVLTRSIKSHLYQ